MTVTTGVAPHAVARNTLLNFIGLAAPAVAAVIALPPVLHRLGAERFGVLTLAYVLIGYLSLFDVGLGRALTQLVASKRGEDDLAGARELIWTYLWSVTALGAVGGGLIAALARPLVRDLLNMSPAVQGEAVGAFLLLGLALPLSLTTPGLRGCLEAYGRFDLVALVRVPSGLALVLAPLAVVLVKANLVLVMASVVLVRVVTWAAQFRQCALILPEVTRPTRPRAIFLRPMLAFAGWLSVANVLAPLMTYFDRFLIGSLLTVSAVTLYATPFDVITRLSILPLALTGVLFPAFATLSAARGDAAPLFRASLRWTLVVLVPPVAVAVVLAHPLLTLWLGGHFADHASRVLQVLAFGVLLNGLAQVPLGLLQGIGKPKDTTLLLLAELPFYLVGLVVGVRTGGIVGAAVAWSLRAGVDAVGLCAVAQWRLTGSLRLGPGLATAPPALVAVLAALATAAAVDLRLEAGLLVLAAVLPLALVAAWRWLLTPDDHTAATVAARALGRRLTRGKE